ncbi:MAG: pyridoxamine 5'-phosphate oxidase family protein, partial [Mycobacterium sp.]
ARMPRNEEEIAQAERAQLQSWTATLKTHYVRIIASQITGRRFVFGPEPDSG